MSIKLNENQLIALHLLASGVKASTIANQLNIREETLSRWRLINEFKEALKDATEIVLREIDETHKNLLISSQKAINEALANKELDMYKKANLALRYLSLIKGKDDITEKSSHNLFKHAELRTFRI
jgi:DNA-binding CsgD family transcriptional regulator